MGKDVGDVIGSALGRVARETAETVANNARKASKGPLSGGRGLAAGVGIAALAPLAVKGAGKLAKGGIPNPVQKVGDKVGDGVKETVGKKVDAAGGAKGLAKEAGKGMLPSFGGDSDGGGSGGAGPESVGSTRRMPIQQAIDVAVPIETAYNQWTQFEEWPTFMHRLDQVTQEDESNVSFKTKIWGVSKQFKAEILEQRPDDRIRWRVTEGVTHSGVVSFHELSDRLTRVEVDIIVEPGSLIEKAARGMRHVKRAVRADLARFKAYVELQEEETGSWRGVIEEGEVTSSKRSSSGSRSKSSSSGGRSKSGSKASSSGSKASSSGTRSRASSSRSKKSSNGGGRSTGTKARSSSSKSSSGGRSSNGARASSNGRSQSSSGRKKAGSRS